MLTWIRRSRVLIGFIILTLVIAWAVKRIDDKDNATRCAVVGLVVQLTANSTRTNQATINSPTQPTKAKAIAQANLDGIRDAQHKTDDLLGRPHGKLCTLTS